MYIIYKININDSYTQVLDDDAKVFTSQDTELWSVLERIRHKKDSLTSRKKVTLTGEERLSGCFCADTVFNLSKKVVTDMETKVLEKGLDFDLIQRKMNEPELRSDVERFCRRLTTKLHFRNEPNPDFNKVP